MEMRIVAGYAGILALAVALPSAGGQRTAVVEDTFAGVARVVAVGDVHGDYDQFFGILRASGLVATNGRWSGGRAHLVQTGDVLDRGPDSRKVMNLLMRLEKEARSAGGAVHALTGNHEAMNVYGDLRYVSAEEYAAFRTRGSERLRDQFYARYVKSLKEAPPPSGVPPIDEALRERFDAAYPLGFVEHRQAFGPDGMYGRWIRGHNAVVKIGGTVFLHGGIAPEYGSWSVRRFNEAVRAELGDSAKLAAATPEQLEVTVVADQEGPLWYRGLATGDEPTLEPHVKAVLGALGAERLVVGHTVTEGAIMPRFGGRVFLVDVGLSRVYEGPAAALIIENDRLYALHRGTRLELPGAGGPALLEYLKRAAALDPPPSRLEKRIQEVERSLVAAPAGAVGER